MRSRSEIFRHVCERNDLRRSSGLPLLDVRTEMEREIERDQFMAHEDAARRHWGDFLRLQAEVLGEFRAKYGPDWGSSSGGRWAVVALAGRRFEEFLAAKGYPLPPPRDAVRYGSARSSD